MIKTNLSKNKLKFAITSISNNSYNNKNNKNCKNNIKGNNNNNFENKKINNNNNNINNNNNNNNNNNSINNKCSSNYFSNDNKNNNNNFNFLGKRTFFTINPQFQNKKHEILQSLSNPHSLKDTYKILGDISLSSYYKTANIRISFFNHEKEKCDIKGVKLFGGDSKDGWIVIVGGREPSQWTNVSLSLYLAALLSQKPLENFDVIIFPVENPIPNNNLDHQQQQATQQPSLSARNNSSLNFSSSHQQQPLFDNYPKGKTNNALNDWLKKSKKEFIPLKFNTQSNSIIPTVSKNPSTPLGLSTLPPSFDLIGGNSYQQQLLPNSNLPSFSNNNDFLLNSFEFSNHIERPNYILDVKNLKFNPNFNTEQLQTFGLSISKQLENIDLMHDCKKISPLEF